MKFFIIVICALMSFSAFGAVYAWQDAAGQKYSSVTNSHVKIIIQQPVQDETIWNNEGNVNVVVQITPLREKENKVQLLVDDKPWALPQNTLQWQLTGLTRGTHYLQVNCFNAQGKLLGTSERRQFYLHQTRVKSP